MAIVSLMDDSTPDKIRKSIFVFASIIFFTLLYKLEITAPKSLFSSASSVGADIVHIIVTYEFIITLLCTFQLYLLIRLYFSWAVTKAKFKKTWIVDEFDDREDQGKLLKELELFYTYCKENPQTQSLDSKHFEEFIVEFPIKVQDFMQQAQEITKISLNSNTSLEQLRDELTKTNQLISDLISNHNLLSQNQKTQLLKKFPHIERITPDAQYPKFTGNLSSLLTEFIDNIHQLEKVELHNNLENIKANLSNSDNSVAETSHALNGLFELQKSYQNFANVFPTSVFRQAIEIKPSDLNKAKKIRETEINIFDLYIPATVGALSIIMGLSIYIEALDSCTELIRAIF